MDAEPKSNAVKFKVVILGPNGAVTNTPAFKLLYPFPTREEAEAHADFCGLSG
jgi:hypothetical protein